MAIPNSHDILQAVTDATPDAIVVNDLDGRDAWASPLRRPAPDLRR
jgi:hypothetical protein